MHILAITEGLTPSQATYNAVAEAKESDPLALPPLGETIDPDALDAIISSAASPGELTVEFEYAGCSVTVTPVAVQVITK